MCESVRSQLQGQIDTGYAEASWTAPAEIADGDYDIAVRVKCATTVGRPLPGMLTNFHAIHTVKVLIRLYHRLSTDALIAHRQ